MKRVYDEHAQRNIDSVCAVEQEKADEQMQAMNEEHEARLAKMDRLAREHFDGWVDGIYMQIIAI